MDPIPAGARIVVRLSTITGKFEEHPLISRNGGTGQSVSKAANGGDTTLLTMRDDRNHVHRQATLPLPESIEGESRR